MQFFKTLLIGLLFLILASCGDPKPVVHTSIPTTATVGEQVKLDARDTELDRTSNYKWTIDSAPYGSEATIENSSSKVATFTPDKPGRYVITVTVSNDRWSDSETITLTVTQAGVDSEKYRVTKLATTLAFPDGITTVGDVCFNEEEQTLSMLAGDDTALSEWLKIDPGTGEVLSRAPNNQTDINSGSEIACVGSAIWATSDHYIYKIDPATGSTSKRINCPTTDTGICEGLAWDGINLWSGASDGTALSSFDTSGNIVDTIPDLWQTVNSTLDLDWDSTSDVLIAIKNGYPNIVDTVDKSLLHEATTDIGNRGGWSGNSNIFWVPNNATQQLEMYYIQL